MNRVRRAGIAGVVCLAWLGACGTTKRDFGNGAGAGAGGSEPAGAAGVGGSAAAAAGVAGKPAAGGAAGDGGTGDAAGEAGVGGAPEPDLCIGVACNAPPAASCASSAQLTSYDAVGSCSNGTCAYTSHLSPCACQDGKCSTDPCLAIECASPPTTNCKDSNTLTSYSKSGTCTEGSCSYAAKDTACQFGCANAACNPDPCLGVTCSTPPAAKCKNTSTKTTYTAVGSCTAGVCSYMTADVACGSNQLCGGAGVCAVCASDASCGPSCTACTGATSKCKDLGTSSQCVACTSNANCSAPFTCNTTTNVCQPPPSCNGLAKTCGPSGTADCCASNLVTGGTFNRGGDPAYPATISSFRLDNYEITVGRFRKFMAAYSQTMIASGAGKNPNNASDPGWDTNWNVYLDVDVAALRAALKCSATYQTFTDNPGTSGAESRPINCVNWYEVEAFCIWDGGRLPTEAEWNYAAAGGSAQRPYPWGNAAPDCNHANFKSADYCVSPGTGALNRVGSESPTGDGLYGQSDLAGNVWEWVQDGFSTYPVPCNNCAVTNASEYRMVRGGNFLTDASYLNNSKRVTGALTERNQGARCARPQ